MNSIFFRFFRVFKKVAWDFMKGTLKDWLLVNDYRVEISFYHDRELKTCEGQLICPKANIRLFLKVRRTPCYFKPPLSTTLQAIKFHFPPSLVIRVISIKSTLHNTQKQIDISEKIEEKELFTLIYWQGNNKIHNLLKMLLCPGYLRK